MKDRKTVSIDIGNSSIVIAIFGDSLTIDETFTTSTQNPQEAADLLSKLDTEHDFADIAVASVVPEARDIVVAGLPAERVYHLTPRTQTVLTDIYETLGADRVANCISARHYYTADAPAVAVLDFGTATTLTAVSSSGVFLGGLITLGLIRTLSSLSTSTAQLPRTRISQDLLDKAFLGPAFDTESAILNGTLLAHIGLVQNWLATVRKELPEGTATVVTGGLSQILGPLLGREHEIHIDQMLTLKGIRLASEAAKVQADRG